MKRFRFVYKNENRFAGSVEALDLTEAINLFGKANYLKEPFWEEPEIVTYCTVCYTTEDGEEVAYSVSW